MTFRDTPTQGEPHAGTGELSLGVQSLAHLEHALAMCFADADAVVVNSNTMHVTVRATGDTDKWRRAAAVLDGVAQQVLEQVHQLHGIAEHRGQRVRADACLGFFDRRAEVSHRLIEAQVEIDRFRLCRAPRDRQIGEQSIEHARGACRAIAQLSQKLVFTATIAAARVFEAAHQASDLLHRFFQIVREDQRHVLELAHRGALVRGRRGGAGGGVAIGAGADRW